MKRIHRHSTLCLLSILLVFLFSSYTFAGSDFRCSGKIISVGDMREYVLDKCGKPTQVEYRTEIASSGALQRYPERHEEFRYLMREIEVEVWTYNLGSTQFIRYLIFKNGRLTHIKTGDYGY
ncbi:MAG: DUF2845 domain-containing protein [Deltaproteobacteria bacterium]|nr:DUF2845 domain-containing protein [Deltaproteobacteria bacterium]